jgi:hypothetical protein
VSTTRAAKPSGSSVWLGARHYPYANQISSLLNPNGLWNDAAGYRQAGGSDEHRPTSEIRPGSSFGGELMVRWGRSCQKSRGH